MLISLSQVIALINSANIKHLNFNEGEFTQRFKDVILLEDQAAALEKGNIYFGYASMLPDELSLQCVGLIVINNCQRDFSKALPLVIEVDENQNIENLYLQVKKLITDLAKESNALEEILSSMFRNKDVQDILDLSYSVLQNPIVLVVAAENSEYVFYSSMKDISEELMPLSELTQSTSAHRKKTLEIFRDGLKRLQSCPTPVLFEDGACFKGRPRIALRLRTHSREELICSLTLYEYDKPLSEKDFMYLNILGGILTERIGTVEFQDDFRKASLTKTILDLINGKPDPNLEKLIALINGNQYRNFIIYALDFESIGMKEYSRLRSDIMFRFYYCVVLRHDSYLVILANPRNDDNTATLEKYLTGIAEKTLATVGTSEQFSDIENLRRYYLQASKAMEVGSKLYGSSTLHKFKELKFFILLNEIPPTARLELFVSSDYLKLKKYDEDKEAELCKTLQCYFEKNTYKQAVCQELNIHRNTLPLRLQKIEDLLGHPLTENEFLFDIAFSTMIDNYIQYIYK